MSTVQNGDRKLSRLQGQVDSKLRLEIEQKKAAHGLKTDCSVPDLTDENEDEAQGWDLIL